MLVSEEITEPVIKIAHDDDYEIYVNGQLLISETGSSEAYKYIKVDSEKGGLFRKGNNLIAVHCVNTGGNQHIDMKQKRKREIHQSLPTRFCASNFDYHSYFINFLIENQHSICQEVVNYSFLLLSCLF